MNQEEVYRKVEVMPEFPGGEQTLMKYLRDNIRYPNTAREKKIEGVVHVEFIVEADGNISNVKVIRDPGGGLGEEAARVIRSMPKWKPGKHKNQPVSVYFALPINFAL